jgi:hypothetical protein
VLAGGGGADQLEDGSTNNNIVNADIYHGGDGLDTVSYVSKGGAEPVTVDLNVTNDNGGETGESDDIAADVENATGGAGANTLIGDENVNTLTGGPLDDTITGGGAADAILAGTGADDLFLRDDLGDTADCGNDADVDTVEGDGPAGTETLTQCALVGDVVNLDTPPVVIPPATDPGTTTPAKKKKCKKGRKLKKVKGKFKCVKKKRKRK